MATVEHILRLAKELSACDRMELARALAELGTGSDPPIGLRARIPSSELADEEEEPEDTPPPHHPTIGSAAASESKTAHPGPRLGSSGRLATAAVVGVGLLVASIALAAAVLLASGSLDASLTPVLQEVLKTSYQALTLGLLGGLAKMVIDARTRDNAAAAELRERRRRYIQSIVWATHRIDNGRTLLKANRSVTAWSDLVIGVLVPARTKLRTVEHDLTNWMDAGHSVFTDTRGIRDDLHAMCEYSRKLIEEYSECRHRFIESQRTARALEGASRAERPDAVWARLLELPCLGDFVRGGADYGAYRNHYLDALRKMRSAGVPRRRTAAARADTL